MSIQCFGSTVNVLTAMSFTLNELNFTEPVMISEAAKASLTRILISQLVETFFFFHETCCNMLMLIIFYLTFFGTDFG